jgi:putative proteasome-type protease
MRDRLFKIVNLYSQQVRRVRDEDGDALHKADLTFNAYALIGGQMSSDSTHRLVLVYPEGNWVEVGTDTPYQIIGASGFGKPILERSVTPLDSMRYAFKVGLAFDGTRICAAGVDYPIDVLLYQRGSFELVEQRYQAAPTGGRSACAAACRTCRPSGSKRPFRASPGAKPFAERRAACAFAWNMQRCTL